MKLVDESEEPSASKSSEEAKRRSKSSNLSKRRIKRCCVADDLPTAPIPSPELPSYRKSSKTGEECGERARRPELPSCCFV